MLMVDIDTSNFEKDFKKYMDYTSRGLEEATLQHSSYIARNAVNVTGAARKQQVRRELEGPSRDYPDTDLATLLVAIDNRKNNKNMTGADMAAAAEKFIQARERSTNFLRSGWLPAVKKLQALVPKKGGKSLKGTTQYGSDKGGSYVVKSMWTPLVELWNDVYGGEKPSQTVTDIIQKGAQEAVDMEADNMRRYIERKQEKAAERFNKGIAEGIFG